MEMRAFPPRYMYTYPAIDPCARYVQYLCIIKEAWYKNNFYYNFHGLPFVLITILSTKAQVWEVRNAYYSSVYNFALAFTVYKNLG